MGQGGSGGQHQGGLNQSRIVPGCEFWPSPAQGHSRRTDTPDEFVACPLRSDRASEPSHRCESTRCANCGLMRCTQKRQRGPFRLLANLM
jgi:hypothetical protein